LQFAPWKAILESLIKNVSMRTSRSELFDLNQAELTTFPPKSHAAYNVFGLFPERGQRFDKYFTFSRAGKMGVRKAACKGFWRGEAGFDPRKGLDDPAVK
jgi:hypothetical protein